MLKQFRGQFDEKNEILSQTRRELFHTKEKLFSLWREKVESQKFETDPFLNAYEKYLVRVFHEYENLLKDNQSEIEILEGLVSSFIRPK